MILELVLSWDKTIYEASNMIFPRLDLQLFYFSFPQNLLIKENKMKHQILKRSFPFLFNYFYSKALMMYHSLIQNLHDKSQLIHQMIQP